jgi:hypothetical protein
MALIADWALPAARFLGGLPDGPLGIILNIIHDTDQMALVGIATQLGPRVTAVCKSHVTLRLKTGWLRGATAAQAEACLAGLHHFPWIDTLSMDLHDLCRKTKLSKIPAANLRALELVQVKTFPDPPLETLEALARAFEALARGCTKLETLTLLDFQNAQQVLLITAGANHLPHLTTFNVSGYRYLTEAPINSLARCCPKLTAFNLKGCHKLMDASIMVLAASCPQLTTLNATYCIQLTNIAILALAKGCPKLKDLTAVGSSQLTDESIAALAEGCPRLTTLNAKGCGRLTDASIVAMAKGCPQLTTLNASWCDRLTGASILAVVEGCRSLTTLYVEGCKHLTDGAIHALAATCPQLTTLNIAQCCNLTDTSIFALARFCPHLKSLNASWCSRLTDKSIIALAERCPQLENLNVSWCDQLTDLAINALMSGSCPRLTILDIEDCGNITYGSSADIFALAADGCPQLTNVYMGRPDEQ